MEKWAPVPGFFGIYEASDMGRIRSIDRRVLCVSPSGTRSYRLKKGVILKQHEGAHGYLQVSLRGEDSSRTKTQLAHRIIALAFYGPCPLGMEVAHNNGVRNDNRKENLRYCTRKNNHADKKLHGTEQSGMNSGLSKLSDEDVLKILSMAKKGKTQEKIAAEIGKVDRSTIGKVIRNRSWKSIPREAIHRKPRRK